MMLRLWKEFRALALFFVLLAAAAAITGVAIHLAVQEYKSASAAFAMAPPLSDSESALRSIANRCGDSISKSMSLLWLFQLILLHMAAVLAWGREFHQGAIQRLLAQPLSRNRIWAEKNIVLVALAFIAITLTFALCIYGIRQGSQAMAAAYSSMSSGSLAWAIRHLANKWLFLSISISLSAIACGPFFSLLLRQAHTAFWASLLAPVAFIVLAPYLNLPAVESVYLGHSTGLPLVLLWFLAFHAAGWFTFRRLEV